MAAQNSPLKNLMDSMESYLRDTLEKTRRAAEAYETLRAELDARMPIDLEGHPSLNAFVEEKIRTQLVPMKDEFLRLIPNQMEDEKLVSEQTLPVLVRKLFHEEMKAHTSSAAAASTEDVAALQQQVALLQAEVEGLKGQLSNLQRDLARVSASAQPQEPAPERKTILPDLFSALTPMRPTPSVATEGGSHATLYAEIPTNGIFFARRMHKEPLPLQTFFLITLLDEQQAHASLAPYAEARQAAFNIPDSYLTPVFELRGQGKPTDYAALRIEPALLRSENGNWRIDKKGSITW